LVATREENVEFLNEDRVVAKKMAYTFDGSGGVGSEFK
jgi:hypothetical protein